MPFTTTNIKLCKISPRLRCCLFVLHHSTQQWSNTGRADNLQNMIYDRLTITCHLWSTKQLQVSTHVDGSFKVYIFCCLAPVVYYWTTGSCRPASHFCGTTIGKLVVRETVQQAAKKKNDGTLLYKLRLLPLIRRRKRAIAGAFVARIREYC